MNLVTVTTSDGTITRMPMANDDDAMNLVAFMIRANPVSHVALDKDSDYLCRRSRWEEARANRYLRSFAFDTPITC